MKTLRKHLTILIGCSGLALSGLCYSQTTLFNPAPAGGQGSSDTILSPSQFRQQVQQLNKQTEDRLTNEARNILPPPKEEDQRNKAPAPRRQQPSRQYGAPQQPQPGSNAGQPAPARDVYTGFGNQPQQQQQPSQQPRPQQRQPASGGGGWNINY